VAATSSYYLFKQNTGVGMQLSKKNICWFIQDASIPGIIIYLVLTESIDGRKKKE
jgi:hypothetical protein